MTFRARLVLVATGAVLVVVLLGAVATYVVAYDSLVGSVDVTLEQNARSLFAGNAVGELPVIENTCGRAAGYCSQMVWFDGRVNPGDRSVLAIPPAVAKLAGSQGNGSELLFTTKVGGIAVREIAYAVPGRYRYSNRSLPLNPLFMQFGGALQSTLPLTGVNEGLHHLVVALWIIILIGVGLAVLLGLGVGRAVLAPLDELTGTVEELARTTDVSRRLDPGGPDELGRLRRAFNRLLAALDASRESQRQLVLDASHELRTPLAIIHGRAEVLLLDPGLARETREGVDMIRDEAARMGRLVANLLLLARGEGGRGIDRQPVDLDALRLVVLGQAQTLAHGVIVTAGRHDPAVVPGDADLLKQVLLNLLDNALAHTAAGGRVELSLSVLDGMARVAVRDSGPGIAPADLERIFDRFFRVDQARTRRDGGAGLGLAIARWIAEAHDGHIEVRSALGQGSTFTLVLPIL